MRGLFAKFDLRPRSNKSFKHTGYVKLDVDDIDLLIDQLKDIKEQYPDASLQLEESKAA
jgi:hypothetical protein